ncbi:hypothetical protein KIN20_029471 [Parelaphostrongylus tenuis]|uniref:Uncharacterized protein n=1 Tax=Parelaphostrongylus tenuis TaxID=148309 RepID=A0AAD5R2F2_PARTN|nr:hypothetical protein KIN20_029471 [Parelaphostrongylus tenuis]
MSSAGTVISRRGCPLLMSIRLLLQLSLTAAHTLNDLARSAVITFEPQSLHDLVEGGNETVFVSVKIPQAEFAALPDLKYHMSFGSFHPEIAYSSSHVDVAKSAFVLDNSSDFYTMNKEVIVHGASMGKTGIRMRLVLSQNWSDVDDSWKAIEELETDSKSILDVWVRRNEASERLTLIFVTSIVILITFGNVLMGCELDLGTVYGTLRRPVAPTIGFFAQFLVMPILAYSIAKSVFVPRGLFSMALGLFITGCSPGGGASNFWTLLLDGNVNLSVTMTFVSTLASLVVMPFWISMFGVEFLQGFSSKSNLRVPYGKIVRSLFSLVIPLLIGVAIKKLKPEWAAKSRKIMRPFIIFVLIFVVVFGVISNWYMFRMMTVPAITGGLLLPWCGFMFGCFMSIITRRTPEDVTAIAIETGVQNTGIAILVIKASFSQPDADIGAVIPVIVACFTPAPLLLGFAIHTTVKMLRKRSANMNEEKPANATGAIDEGTTAEALLELRV